MAILPAGFALPPMPYLVALVVGTGAVAVSLWRLAPPVTAQTVLGLAPWMVLGSALHAWYVLDASPAAVAPLLGAPAVYGTVFIGLGLVWIGLSAIGHPEPPVVARRLGLVGAAAFVLVAGAVFASGPTVSLTWPAVGLVVATALAATTWLLVRWRIPAVAVAGWPGTLVVLAHAIDGVSTAIGVDVLGFGERTPASQVILEVAARLPTAEVIGVGWLFVLVKLGLAGAIVALFAGLVEEDPREGYLLLALVAAVGLGPGVHNLLLYAVVG